MNDEKMISESRNLQLNWAKTFITIVEIVKVNNQTMLLLCVFYKIFLPIISNYWPNGILKTINDIITYQFILSN